MLHAYPTIKARTCYCWGSGVLSGHWFPPRYRCADWQNTRRMNCISNLFSDFMFSNLTGSGYIISILYCCPHILILYLLFHVLYCCVRLLTANIGLRDLLEVFGSNDLGRETTKPDSLLTHAIDVS